MDSWCPNQGKVNYFLKHTGLSSGTSVINALVKFKRFWRNLQVSKGLKVGRERHEFLKVVKAASSAGNKKLGTTGLMLPVNSQ